MALFASNVKEKYKKTSFLKYVRTCCPDDPSKTFLRVEVFLMCRHLMGYLFPVVSNPLVWPQWVSLMHKHYVCFDW